MTTKSECYKQFKKKYVLGLFCFGWIRVDGYIELKENGDIFCNYEGGFNTTTSSPIVIISVGGYYIRGLYPDGRHRIYISTSYILFGVITYPLYAVGIPLICGGQPGARLWTKTEIIYVHTFLWRSASWSSMAWVCKVEQRTINVRAVIFQRDLHPVIMNKASIILQQSSWVTIQYF